MIQFKNVQKTWIDISPKMKYKWLIIPHMKRMLNIISHYGNTNQNHLNPLGWLLFKRIKQVLARICRDWNSCALLLGMFSIMENCMAVLQKVKQDYRMSQQFHFRV